MLYTELFESTDATPGECHGRCSDPGNLIAEGLLSAPALFHLTLEVACEGE